MSKLKKVLAAIAAVIIISLLTWFGYVVSRHINWSMGYEDMVEEKVREMVKSECLK